LGRVTATGRGVFVTGREAAGRIGLKLDGARVAVQGFGNVGETAAQLFAAAGAQIVAIQDSKGTISNERGLDVAMVKAAHDSGGVSTFAAAEHIGQEDFWDVDCDILIPAALEGQITPERAKRTRAKLVLEGANGPTTPEADEFFKANKIFNIPDFLCNAGGVTTSYFESVQNDMNFYWPKEEVLEKLDQKMTSAFHGVLEMSEKEGVYMRDAAYMVAISRVVKAMELRGWLSGNA
jgi:glutamate dehydrogenase (NAD(P)+)